jgi:hypothetical protein
MQAISRIVKQHSPAVIFFQVEKQTRSDLKFLFQYLLVDQAGIFTNSGGYAVHPQDLPELRMAGGVQLLASVP